MFYDNLAQVCKENNFKIATIVKECGGAVGSIDGWKKGAIPRSDIVAKLALRLNVSTDFLILGSSSKIKLSNQENELLNYFSNLSDEDKGRILGKAETLAELAAERAAKERAAEQPKKEVQIDTPAADEQITPNDLENNQPEPTEILAETQVISDEEPRKLVLQLFDLPVSAGTGVILSDNRYEPIEVYWSHEAEQANYVLRVFGNSMEDDFHDGDLVLVESVKDISVGEIGIFVADGEGYIKVKGENALISLNSSYKPKPYSKFSTIQCIGRVLGKAKMV